VIGFHSTILLRSILITLCLITLCFAFPARGQTGRAAAACGAETNSAAMRICENARYEKAQQTLNSVSADLMQHLDAAGKRKLRLAQSAWVQFRQANADFQAEVAGGGTIGPLISVTVMADMTEARARDLKKSLRE
jgi:uncharacterized protein YecT (DUF1311 family)